MRLRLTPGRGAVAALGLALSITAGACAPEAPAPTTTSTSTTSTSTTSTSTTSTSTTSTSTTSTTLANQSPTASASAIEGTYFALPVANSSAGSVDLDGTIASFNWNFGDGTTSSAANPTKSYRYSGPFTVTLTVTDNQGATGTKQITVTQAAPAADVFILANPVSIPTKGVDVNVRVWWKNQTASSLTFIDICRKSTNDVTFNFALDCATLAQQLANGTPNGSGTAVVPFFRGPEASELGWGFYTAGDTADPGITKVTTGYLRVTNGSQFNTLSVKEIPFTITG